MFVHESWHLVSLLRPQDDKPLHSWLDLYPGFCSQGPARHLLDVTPHTVLRFPLVKTFVVSQGKELGTSITFAPHTLCSEQEARVSESPCTPAERELPPAEQAGRRLTYNSPR